MTFLIVSNLTCEYRTNPLGIDVLRPRLSWQLESNQRGTRQTAYRIRTAGSMSTLSGNEALWDSGKVSSSQSIHVHIMAQCLYPVNAYTGRYGSGTRPVRKLKVLRPGGKWACWSAAIGKRNGSAPIFLEGQELPARLHFSAKNLRLKMNWSRPGCMQLRSGCMNAT